MPVFGQLWPLTSLATRSTSRMTLLVASLRTLRKSPSFSFALHLLTRNFCECRTECPSFFSTPIPCYPISSLIPTVEEYELPRRRAGPHDVGDEEDTMISAFRFFSTTKNQVLTPPLHLPPSFLPQTLHRPSFSCPPARSPSLPLPASPPTFLPKPSTVRTSPVHSPSGWGQTHALARRTKALGGSS